MASSISDRYGIPFHVELNQSSTGSILKLKPEGLHKSEGFQIRVEIGWKSLWFEFVPGSFAGSLIEHMGMAPKESQVQFSMFIRLMVGDGGRFGMSVNGEDADPFSVPVGDG